jgi:hypothetical protein
MADIAAANLLRGVRGEALLAAVKLPAPRL